jgi:hypothetical protein
MKLRGFFFIFLHFTGFSTDVKAPIQADRHDAIIQTNLIARPSPRKKRAIRDRPFFNIYQCG